MKLHLTDLTITRFDAELPLKLNNVDRWGTSERLDRFFIFTPDGSMISQDIAELRLKINPWSFLKLWLKSLFKSDTSRKITKKDILESNEAGGV